MKVHGEKEIYKRSDCYTRVSSFFSTNEDGYKITMIFFFRVSGLRFKECFAVLFKNVNIYRMPEMMSFAKETNIFNVLLVSNQAKHLKMTAPSKLERSPSSVSW